MPTLSVPIPGAAYDYLVERDALSALGGAVRERIDHDRAVLCVDRNIEATHGRRALASLRNAGFDVLTVSLEARETAKTLDRAREVYAQLLAARIDRHTPLIALGGGVVGDTAGFVAATYLRGVPLVQCPTTLLAMVDASIGGKTGVNFELPDGSLGKNLIGSFYQPSLVLADPLTLETLAVRQLRSGLAECVKHGMLAAPEILSALAEHAEEILAVNPAALSDLIALSAQVKIDIVARDALESGERATLNLGHTFAHAIETLPEQDLLHGEAVAIGLVAACECAVRTSRLDPERRDMVRDLLGFLELPVALRAPASAESLLARMGYDKKSERGRLRLILPIEFGEVEIVDDPPMDAVRHAWRAVGASG